MDDDGKVNEESEGEDDVQSPSGTYSPGGLGGTSMYSRPGPDIPIPTWSRPPW